MTNHSSASKFRLTRSRYSAVVVAIVACGMTACASRPRQTPLPTTPIETGAETMTAVRNQLQGRWTLVSLQVLTADGQQRAVEATGVLTADVFGGMEVEYRLSESGQQALAGLGIDTPNPVISSAGRVVIDPQQKRITYLDDDFEKRALGFDPKLAALRANPFALERVRYYEFTADGTLRLSTRYPNGRDASIGHWKKAS